MSRPKPIQVYEHGFLKKSDEPNQDEISTKQWEALGEYNRQYGGQYFAFQNNGIKFCQYVGVIQVGAQTIEILPKIDKHEADTEKNKWQSVLLDMLSECNWMQQHAHQNAPLRIRHRNILETYLDIFLNHCQTILRNGLFKHYRAEQGNMFALKGKLLFASNIRKNELHAERFYTRHIIYDNKHQLNQILLMAIRLIPRLSTHLRLKDKVARLLLEFPDLPDLKINTALFEKIKYNRKNAHYEDAINIAAMLLLHYRPDLKGGNRHVLAILFEMNDLWEEFVYRQLKRKKEIVVLPQQTRRFWEPNEGNSYKIIKPDIVVKYGTETFIVDTKWKLPENNKPADNDLKQMFVYNEYWKSSCAILVYPDPVYKETPNYISGKFTGTASTDTRHSCSMFRISVLNKEGTKLDKELGSRIFETIKINQFYK